MKYTAVLVVIGLFVFALIFGITAYVNNLDEEIQPAVQSERKGRAKYLEGRFSGFLLDIFREDSSSQ